MRLFLFLVLFTFPFHAKSEDVFSVRALLNQYAVQITSEKSEYCVQKNDCLSLGYTETSCPYGGVACPFDKDKLSCSARSCKDLLLFDIDKMPPNMDCVRTQVSGITCYDCQCTEHYINPQNCGGVIAKLTTDKEICATLGYRDSITNCNEYLACPSNPNKVHCLDVVGCRETKCLAKTEVPENAEPSYGSVNCECGGDKKVITGWTCNEGYKTEGNACVLIECSDDEFDNDNISDCYRWGRNTGEGWRKIETTHTGAKQCYKCLCDVPSECKYTEDNKGEYGQLEEACCDGTHYSKCVRACPQDTYIPDVGAVKEYADCTACLDKTGKPEVSQYVVGWHCDDGYQKNNQVCDPKPCPENKDGKYYSVDYTSADSCKKIKAIGEILTSGWNFNSKTGEMSGDKECALCQCPEDSDEIYTWTLSATQKASDSVFEDLGCNGKYKNCTITDDAKSKYLEEEPEHANYSTPKVCGKTYYSITGCKEGYEYPKEQPYLACVERDCSEYTLLESDINENTGKYESCQSGETTKYKLLKCNDTVYSPKTTIKNIKYRMTEDEMSCCRVTCDPNDDKYIVGSECPEGKTQDGETITNGCGDTCIKCK